MHKDTSDILMIADEKEWVLERAAILEFMFGMPRKQAEEEARKRYVSEKNHSQHTKQTRSID